MLKKFLLISTIAVAAFIGFTPKPTNAQTLYQCYQERGMAWTSVSGRAVVAAENAVWKYKGTAAQNQLLTSRLCPTNADGEAQLGFSVVTGYEKNIRTTMTATQTTVPVTSLALKDGTTLTMSMLGSVVFLTIEPGTIREEIVACTDINSSTINFDPCTRGLSFSGTSTVSVAANRKTHNAGSKVVLSNVHYVYEQFLDVTADKSQTVAGDKTITGIWTFNTSLPRAITSTPTLPSQLVTLDYLTTVTSTGCANASTAVRGCVEKATNAEVEAGTATGATGAQTFVGADSWLEYSDTHWSNNFPTAQTLAAFNIVYMSSTGSYYIAHGNVQSEIDRIAGVNYYAVVTSSYPIIYKSGSVIYGNVTMTAGSLVYLSDSGTATTTPGTIRKVLGVALGGAAWDFNPTVDTPNATPAAGVIPLASASGTLDIWLSMIRGNGSDGTVTISASTSLSRDMFYNNLTINSGVVVSSSYKIHVLGTLTNAGTIQRNGFSGSNGTAGNTGQDALCTEGAGGTGGAAVPDGSLGGSLAGKTGGAGGDGGGQAGNNGTAGTLWGNVISGTGTASGAGGAGTGGSGGAAGSAGAPGAATTSVNSPTSTFIATAQFDFNGLLKGWSGSGGGGGGGGGYNGIGGTLNGCGGGGGGSASSGGTIWISANSIVNSGTISSNGGNGGNGGAGGDATTDGGNGGGGAPGNGGNIFLFYHTLTNTGSITVTAGTAGTAGVGGNGGSAATAGTAGKVWHFQF